MFSQYHSNVKTIISFLKRLGIKVNDLTVNETLQNHPDWPSLLGISDSLKKWQINNGAGKIDTAFMDELPTPFIAYTNDEIQPLVIVNKVSENTIEICKKNSNKTKIENRKDFIKKWSGIYLVAEPNLKSGEVNYKLKKRDIFFNSLIPIAAIASLLILSFCLLRVVVSNASGFQILNVAGIYLQYSILLVGILVTTLLLWYEIDQNNPLLQKVCTGISKGNCSAILSSRSAKVFKWLSWSEVGFFYFIGAFLTLLFAGNNIDNSLRVIGWLNVLALPYTIFSVYFQWRVAKQWCILCLAVQALLILGGINVFTQNFLFPLSAFPISSIFNYMLLYIIPMLAWYSIKPSILRLQEAKKIKRDYSRIKFNTDIFETLLKKQKVISLSPYGLGIDLGNPSASNTLIKVCNPYCGPCSKAHSKIEELLEQNANLKVKIIFTTPNNEANHAIKPTRHLMAIVEQSKDEKTVKQSLDNWYLAGNKDYDKFASKYPMNGELLKQGLKIEAMDKWCNEMKIDFTPTIFINGYQLPDAYSIEDLQYFLLE